MSNKTMKAIRLYDYSGPEGLKLEETSLPQPGEGQALIRVMSAGVNPADWKMGGGYFKQFMPLQFPWTPGMEGAGIVEVAEGMQLKPGQAVFGPMVGAYAEYALANTVDLQPKPVGLTFDQAASIPVGALTAWGAVIDAAQVQPGLRVLVHGAAGGVGVFAVQLARWKEAHVIGTSSAANLELVQSLGAEQALDYNAAPFESLLHDLDVVIDTVGGDLPQRSLKVLRKDGILVTVAGMLAPDMGADLGIRAVRSGRAAATALGQIRQLVEAGLIHPVVGKVFPLAQAAQAQELSRTGHGHGRIVLRIAD